LQSRSAARYAESDADSNAESDADSNGLLVGIGLGGIRKVAANQRFADSQPEKANVSLCVSGSKQEGKQREKVRGKRA